MKEINQLLKGLEDFDKDPKAAGYQLRLDLADMLIDGMKKKGWSQKQLADVTGMRAPIISRVVNAETNCTFETAGKLLKALGVKARLNEGQVMVSYTAQTPMQNVIYYTGANNIGYQEKENRHKKSR